MENSVEGKPRIKYNSVGQKLFVHFYIIIILTEGG